MSEFQQIMKDWRRMCLSYKSCGDCPMMDADGCAHILCSEGGIQCAVPEIQEAVIKKWASEHPIVYPTWIEWLKKFGIISFEPDFHSLLSAYPTRTNSVKAYINEEGGKPIPADTARELGIEPKEDA